MSSFNDVPGEILEEILSYCALTDGNIAQVCKRWRTRFDAMRARHLQKMDQFVVRDHMLEFLIFLTAVPTYFRGWRRSSNFVHRSPYEYNEYPAVGLVLRLTGEDLFHTEVQHCLRTWKNEDVYIRLSREAIEKRHKTCHRRAANCTDPLCYLKGRMFGEEVLACWSIVSHVTMPMCHMIYWSARIYTKAIREQLSEKLIRDMCILHFNSPE